MREIKFKYWDRTNNCWINEVNVDKANIDICQYIGRLDKNGNEIYEGDIVQMYSEGRAFYIGTIEYNPRACCYEVIIDVEPNDFIKEKSAVIYGGDEYKIIGHANARL